MNALSIKQRLMMIIFLAVFALVAVTITALMNKKEGMLIERQNQIQVLVETAETMVNQLYEKAQSGSISMEEAQQRAKEAFDAMRYGENGYFMIYDTSNVMVHHPISANLIGRDLSNLKDVNGVYIVRDQIAAAQNGGGFVSYFWKKAGLDDSVYPKIAYSALYEPWGWVLSTGLYVDDVESVFWKDVTRLLAIVAGIAGLLLLVSLAISRSIVTPLVNLKSLLTKAEKNLDLRVRFKVRGRNEIASVGLAFNNLMDAFEDTLIGISKGATKLNDEVSTLEDLSNHIVGASTRQSDDTGSIAALVEEFSASISTIANDADRMKDLSSESGEQAHEGAATMRKTLSNMDEMSDKSRKSSDAVASLDKHSKEIEGIIGVINDVAEQTNLLALNAAIEAARAGDQGRGFAVVADQVRSLAEKTSDSTKLITSTIQELRSGIEDTVQHIEDSVISVDHNMGQTQQAEQKVLEMQKMSQELIGIIEDVSGSLHEQSSANNELSNRVLQIAEMATNNHSSAESVQGSAKEVNTLVSAFNSSVNRFKVSENA